MSAAQAPTRQLGRGGLVVSAEGLGCMSMSAQFYGPTGPAEEPEAVATILRAIELGVTFLDTADIYGAGSNEELVGRAITGRRTEVVLATKFGITAAGGAGADSVNGRPEYVRQCCERSLRRLQTDHIDLYYAHRLDPTVPVEDTVGAMAELVAEGKVRYLGLCEASAASLERAVAVHPIAALQSEWSLWTRDLETEVLPTARQLGIGLVPFSPLGRGMFTGALNHRNGFGGNDYRELLPRFQGENFQRNLALVAELEALAADMDIKPGQLALAWLMGQGQDVVPIPGTKRRSYLEENAAAMSIALSPAELDHLDQLFAANAWSGDRYGHESGYADTPATS